MIILENKINKGNLKFLNEMVPKVNQKINIPDIDNICNNIGTGKKEVKKCKIRKVKIEMRNPQAMKDFMMTFHPIYNYSYYISYHCLYFMTVFYYIYWI